MRKIPFALLVFMPMAAHAADLGAKDYGALPSTPLTQWTGFYLGASLGAAASIGNVDINRPGVSIDGLGTDAILGMLTIGYDYHLPASKVVVGLYGNYVVGSQVWELTTNQGFNLSAELSNEWSGGAKIGYLMTPGILSYAKVGYARANLNVSASIPLPEVKSPRLSGPELGTGIQIALGGGLSVTSEYMYTAYGDAELYSRRNVDVSLSTGEHKIMTGLVYKFGQSASRMDTYK